MHATEGAFEVRASRADDAEVASGGGDSRAEGRECRNNRPRDDLPNSWKGS